MRNSLYAILLLAPLAGCQLLKPDSPLNVNRGEHRDEYDEAGKEGRARTAREPQVDPLGQWLYSPEARQINSNLGVAD